MSIETSVHKTESGKYQVIATYGAELIQEFTIQAIHELCLAVAGEIAKDVFEGNKEKILAGVNIDLMVTEIQKILLDKIKAHAKDKKKDKPEDKNK